MALKNIEKHAKYFGNTTQIISLKFWTKHRVIYCETLSNILETKQTIFP